MPPEHEANNKDVRHSVCFMKLQQLLFLLFDFQLAPHLKHLPHRTAAVAGLLYFR